MFSWESDAATRATRAPRALLKPQSSQIEAKSTQIQPKSNQNRIKLEIKSNPNPNPNQSKILVDNSEILIKIIRILVGNPSKFVTA